MGKALELTESQRKSIAESLFTVKKTVGKEMHGLCPFHEDTNPSFSYNFSKDVYHCLTCGAEDGDLIKLWMKVKGIGDAKEGFLAFCSEYGLNTGGGDGYLPSVGEETKSKSSKPQGPPPLCDVYKMFPPLPEEWVTMLMARRGWTRDGIEKAGLRLQTHYRSRKDGELVKLKKPERIAIPIFDEKGKVRNLRLYKPGAKTGKIISWATEYGSARLYPARPEPDGVVLLVEGEPDRLCAMNLGFNAITQTSKPKKWSKEHKAKFTDRDVVIAYDADQAGQNYADQAASELVKVARTVRLLSWPDNMGKRADGLWPEDHGEDLTDFFVKHKGTAEELTALMDLATPYSKLTEEEVLGCAAEFFEIGPNNRYSFKVRLLVDRILKDKSLLYDEETGLLYLWNGMYWERYAEALIKEYAIRLLSSESQKSRVEDAVFQVKMLSAVPHGRKPNDRGEWVCIQNGMFNPVTLELLPFDKEYYCTFQLPVAYSPRHHKYPEEFLEYLAMNVQTAGPINQIQEFFGYLLYQKPLFQKALICLGPGEDGKSILLNIAKAFVGEENCSAVSLEDLEDQNYRAALYGKMLNVCAEGGSQLVESRNFKLISVGDAISGAFKYSHPFMFSPTAKLMMAFNDLQPVKDNSHGFYRRLLIVTFKRQFKEGDPDRDPHLEEKLKKNLTGIFHWALVGLHRLLKQGYFTQCDEHTENILEYKRQNDGVLCFVEDCLDIGQGYEAIQTEIYPKYKSYCSANGMHPKKSVTFWKDLKRSVGELKTSRPTINGERKRIVEGLRLKMIGADTDVA